MGNKVQGNTIGLDLDDEPAGGNTGIYVGNTPDAVIGAVADPDDLDILDYDFGNVVAGIPLGEGGNGVAITGGTTGAVVAANFIGVDREDGQIGNVAIGIHVAGSSNNQFGPGNTIAYNEGGGVQVSDGDGNRIVANSIHDNGDPGITLGAANVDVGEPTLTEATIVRREARRSPGRCPAGPPRQSTSSSSPTLSVTRVASGRAKRTSGP